MRNAVIAIMLLLLFTELPAQENNIRDQILSYKESEFTLINKGRRLLIDNLESFKMEEAINVKNGLLKEFDGNVSEVFFNSEYIHLLYWTREFDILLNYLKQVDFEHPVSHNVRISSQTDDFFRAVFKHTAENRDILEIDIKNWELTEMERDFLLLLLNDIAAPTPPNSTRWGQVEINAQADRFLADHPNSPYEDIVRQQIRYVYKEADWGTYCDFGLGAIFNQGDLAKQMGHGVIFDMLFEYRHRKAMGMLGFGFSGQKLRKDMDINQTVWEEGSHSMLAHIYLNAGYLAFENRRWSIYPYAGAGFTGYSANEKDYKEDENLEKLGLSSFFTQVGLGVDLKSSSIGDHHPSNIYSRLSLKYSYRMPRFDRKHPSLDGSQHVITLSWGFGGRPKQRDL